jgi:signal transduction histidine kinase
MRFSFSNKLFAGFSLLSLLTILLGVTTFTTIEEIKRSQKKTTLLQEFELRVHTLETATNTQSNVAFISAKSHEDFLDNLERSKQAAEEILNSEYCPAEQSLDGSESCQSSMRAAMDFYPLTAIEHYEKTLLAHRLTEKNQDIYRKMLELQDRLTEEDNNNPVGKIINQLEMLKHDFEESNNLEALETMKAKLGTLKELEPNPEFLKLAETFVANSEQGYRNRLEIIATQESLAENTRNFRAISRGIREELTRDKDKYEQEVRGLIMFLGLCSIVMTLLFWLLTSRRLSRFLINQRKAINSIKTGHYDYSIRKDSNDELNELYLFTKDLAENLKEEVAEREYSQHEKKDLEVQLMQAQRLESIGILAGGIAHDFNNLLTGITGYTDLALARLEDNHPVKRYLETIADSGRKAGEMTRQLLLFSRKQETTKQVTNLNTLISNLLKMLDRMIGEDIVLEFEAGPDLPRIMADQTHIEHLLLNMAVNAKGAMPEGGKLTIRTSTAVLDDAAVDRLDKVDPGNFVRISITDSGSGMTNELKERILDPLLTTKANDQGNGLGLATVLGIIKQHNGHITVESAGDHSTIFNFYLPAIDAELHSEEAEPAVFARTISRGRETILLVDDNDTARDFVCETLEYCGYKVLTAGSGNEAVKIMNQTDYPIDLLLTDVIMPNMNGGKLAAKARKLHPEIKVIFISGYDGLPADQDLRKIAAAENFLRKPMSIDMLSRKVREVLDR